MRSVGADAEGAISARNFAHRWRKSFHEMIAFVAIVGCIFFSHALPGDFVAMMQGGVADHQRAADAVAQVMPRAIAGSPPPPETDLFIF